MKKIITRSLLSLLPLLAVQAQAQFLVTDDFNDPARDVLKWGVSDEGSGDSELIESSGKLNFVAPGGFFAASFASRVWQGRAPGTTNDWQAGVDIQLSNLSLFGEDGVMIGLSAGDADNPDHRLVISLQYFRPDPETSFRALVVEVPAGEGGSGASVVELTSSTAAQLRLNYDANSRMLLAGVLGAGNVVRTVGAWNTGLWGMNAASEFALRVDAQSQSASVGVGQISADNFSISELAPRAIGVLQGSDDFNDNVRNTTSWGKTDAYVGVGALSETNSVMRFFTLGEGASETDSATRLWSPGAADASKSWTAQVDVALPSVPLGTGGEVEIGLAVLNLADPGDRATVSLNLATFDGETISRRFLSRVERDGFDFPDLEVAAETLSQSAAVRARWDAVAQLLSLEYDANGSTGGYVWTPLKSYSLTSGDSTWELGRAGRFQLGVFGRSLRGTPVPVTANVRLDNFVATGSAVVDPVKFLASKLLAKELQLQWKGGVGPYQLQSKAEVNGAVWADVGVPSNQTSATVDATPGRGFFRVLDKGQ